MRTLPARSDREILEEIENEVVVIEGRSMTKRELRLRVLNGLAMKGNQAAAAVIERLIRAATEAKTRNAGVLLLPGPMSVEEWEAATARQQAKYRSPDYGGFYESDGAPDSEPA